MAMHAHNVQDNARVEVRTRFGTLPVPKENLLTFPQGLPGFEDQYQFALFHDEDNPSVFYLQSVDDPDVRLPLTSPHWFRVDYQITLNDEETELLQAESVDDLEMLVIVAEDESGLRAHFRAPLVINTRRRIAIQKLLDDPQGSLVITAH